MQPKTHLKNSVSAAVRELETAKRLVLAELSSYPTPVSGCDAQYNYLLSERTKILGALESLTSPVFVPTPRDLSESSDCA